MKIRTTSLVILLGAALACGGCASQLDRIETGLQVNRDEISRLEAENRKLQQDVAALSEFVRLRGNAGDESGAMGMAKLTQVDARLEQLLGKLEDNAEYMRNLSARVDLLVTRSGIPTLGEYRPPTSDQAAGALPEEGRTILDAADLDRSRGNNDLARSGYEEFLQRFGNTEGAARALFRLGDLEMDAGAYQTALAHFDSLVTRFPSDPNASAGLYKARSCLLSLGKVEDAAARSRQIMDMYPDSQEAALLREETQKP